MVEDVDIANVVYTIREGADLVTPTLEEDTDEDDEGSDVSIEPIDNIEGIAIEVVLVHVLPALEPKEEDPLKSDVWSPTSVE